MDIHKEIEDCRNSTKECIEVMTAYAEGQLIEVRARDREGSNWLPADTPVWNFGAYEYRIRPRETPSIDWSAVHWRYNYLVVDQFQQGQLFAAKPSVGGFGWEGAGGVVGKTAALFESFSPGDVPWRESMASRWYGDGFRRAVGGGGEGRIKYATITRLHA